jgi:hypothetical protein
MVTRFVVLLTTTVVDVVVDDVGWRRCDLRRCYPYRDGPIFRGIG